MQDKAKLRDRFVIGLWIGVPLALVAFVFYGIYEKNRAKAAERKAGIQAQVRLDCAPWRNDRSAYYECGSAWYVWQRCRNRLEKNEGVDDADFGVICTHPQFRFEERLQAQVDSLIR